MRNLFIAALFASAAAAPGHAATVGMPFLVIDQDLSGNILDHFDGAFPSSVIETSLRGRISQSYGWPAAVGQVVQLNTYAYAEMQLSIGANTSPGDFFVTEGNGWGGDFPDGPYFIGSGPGPGDLNYSLTVIPNYTETELGGGLYEFSYDGIFSAFSGRVAEFPDFELVMSVYLDGPLPTKTFSYQESEDGPILSFDYVEGPLNISRITLGLVGGEPVPSAVVPLPAALPLLLGALGGMALIRRRRVG